MNDSNVISSVGLGTVWRWSNSQIDSNPSRSACCATSTVRAQARSVSQPSYSPVHPCGTMTPSFIASFLTIIWSRSGPTLTWLIGTPASSSSRST